MNKKSLFRKQQRPREAALKKSNLRGRWNATNGKRQKG